MGKHAIPAMLAFLGAYVCVEAYYAGKREGTTVLAMSVDLPDDISETNPTPKSQPDNGEQED